MPFPMLFSVIREHLSKSSIDSLEHHYSNFKNRKISREVLIKMVRKIAGDKLLIAAIKSIKSQKNGMEGFKGAELGRQHVLNADKVHLKNEFTSSLNEENGTEGFKSAEHSPQHVLGSEKVHSKNEFTSFLNETSVIGPSGLQGQCPHRPKPIIDAQQFPCKNDFTSHNGQALF
uniref:RST domain-containing protein n=1 Tax=Picea sitchensis TaxID=3332 RepID=D5ADV4_PICSI|nr:unknown [Picea sitchensis]